jgi:hypothetical protein
MAAIETGQGDFSPVSSYVETAGVFLQALSPGKSVQEGATAQPSTSPNDLYRPNKRCKSTAAPWPVARKLGSLRMRDCSAHTTLTFTRRGCMQ